MKIPEHQEQVALFAWADLHMVKYPALVNMFAIPNGGKRSKIAGAMLKREGVKAGVPDIMVAYPCNGYHGLFIEMKRRDGGNVSTAQVDWIKRLNDAGYMAKVAYGAKEAQEIIIGYLVGS